ncbi:hypothetical protein SBRY_40277 [Actinacidiphila bryophytorum]|uniref:GNAT family N-acetyltransferase n=1 Tax=Actinacidiphila bryophytorum TaxID=1436133 RepID=A0A9W4H2M7_9ACTN|nr:hypothetical protein SBRY_40277 [Actinacidiphila bryophytorum]
MEPPRGRARRPGRGGRPALRRAGRTRPRPRRAADGAGAEARERGLHPVLDVVESDGAAVALYERLGWELLDTVEQWWGPGQTVTVRCYAAGS